MKDIPLPLHRNNLNDEIRIKMKRHFFKFDALVWQVFHFGNRQIAMPWHQTGNPRVWDSNPGGSRQPLTLGCQINNKQLSQPKQCSFNEFKNLQGTL